MRHRRWLRILDDAKGAIVEYAAEVATGRRRFENEAKIVLDAIASAVLREAAKAVARQVVVGLVAPGAPAWLRFQRPAGKSRWGSPR